MRLLHTSYPLELIVWLDHYELGPAWEELEDSMPQIAVCWSVGWVIAETDEIISLVPHLSFEPEDETPTGTSSQLNIAKGAVRSRSRMA